MFHSRIYKISNITLKVITFDILRLGEKEEKQTIGVNPIDIDHNKINTLFLYTLYFTMTIS